jgi:hypothetical protein
MPASGGRVASTSARTEVWHASTDAIVATVAGGLALLVFYPLTLCAAAVKRLVRTMRPHPVSHRDAHSVTGTN